MNGTKAAGRILVIDDERGMRDLLCAELGGRGYAVAAAADGREGLERLKSAGADLLLSDMRMPGLSGAQVLEAARAAAPACAVVLMTGYGDVATAVAAMKRGACDFLTKPLDLDELFAVVERALADGELKALGGVYELSRSVLGAEPLEALLARVAELVRRVFSADDVSILLRRGGRLVLGAEAGADCAARRAASLALGERVAGRVLAGGEPVLIAGPLAADPRFADVPALRAVRSALLQPLVLGGESLGVLCVNRTRGAEPFAAGQLPALTIFGAQLAQALYGAQAQARLVEADRLAGVGRLAASVAHEINNPLTSILLLCDLLGQTEGLAAPVLEDLRSIGEQGRRCRDIARELLGLSRRVPSGEAACDAVALMVGVLKLARHELARAGLELVTEWPEASPRIRVHAPQIQQVLLNLIVNARQAMASAPVKRLALSVEEREGRVLMRVADSGPGIRPEDLDQVFEPFFTTKPPGEGTGLGLAISAGLVAAHGGTLTARSTPGAGATFTIDLPAA